MRSSAHPYGARSQFTPFAGAELGSGIYAALLMLVAYCAGIQAFGADWLAQARWMRGRGARANGGAP